MMKQCEIPYVSLDWLVMGFSNGIPEYGKRIEQACKKYDIRSFDTSKNFMQVLDRAMEYLLRKE
jgi:hypothetical protein